MLIGSPESRVQSPESRVQDPESSPGSSPGFILCHFFCMFELLSGKCHFELIDLVK